MTVFAEGWEGLGIDDHEVLATVVSVQTCVKRMIRMFSWRNKTRRWLEDT